jgi:hypothetical protein
VIHPRLPHARQMILNLSRRFCAGASVFFGSRLPDSKYTGMRAGHGTGMNEYLLPVCLIGVLVLAGTPILIASMSHQVKTSTVTTLGDVNKQAVASVVANAALGNISASDLAHSDELLNEAISAVELEEGQQRFDNEIGQMIKDVETLGAAGTLRQMSQQLLRQLEAMPEKTKLSDEQKQSLIKLANQVNRVASIQALIEETAQESLGDKDYFKNTLKTLDGKDYSSAELIMLIGSSSDSLSGITEEAKPYFENKKNSVSNAESHKSLKTYGRELAGIVESYEKAKAQGAITDPRLKMLVTLYTQKAIFLSQYMAFTSSQIITSSLQPEQLSASLVSQLTEQQAKKIQAQAKRKHIETTDAQDRESTELADQERDRQERDEKENEKNGKRKALGHAKKSGDDDDDDHD